MSKLICSKCGGTLFKNGNHHVVLTVYVPNGLPPRQESYICVNCGHEEIVTYPAVYFEEPKPFEVELPEDTKPQSHSLKDLEGTLVIPDPNGDLFTIANCENILNGPTASGTVCIDEYGHLISTGVK